MKVIVSGNSLIWDGKHPALRQFGDDVILFSHQTPEELLEALGGDRNILVLTDNDPVSFYPYQILAASYKSRRIHLFACLPFSYESSRKKQEIRELLSDMSMVKSLCLLELDSFLADMGYNEKLGRLQERIREAVTKRLLEAIPAIRTETDEFSQYLYDFQKGEYVRQDLSDMEALLSQIPALRQKRPAVPVPERPKEPELMGISSAEPEGTVTEGVDLEPGDVRIEETLPEDVSGPKSTSGMQKEAGQNTEPGIDIPEAGKGKPEEEQAGKRRSFFDLFKRKKR